eukprot:scaffold12932_cov59-Cylindrotheca_fusiformis.AAC.2
MMVEEDLLSVVDHAILLPFSHLPQSLVLGCLFRFLGRQLAVQVINLTFANPAAGVVLEEAQPLSFS